MFHAIRACFAGMVGGCISIKVVVYENVGRGVEEGLVYPLRVSSGHLTNAEISSELKLLEWQDLAM